MSFPTKTFAFVSLGLINFFFWRVIGGNIFQILHKIIFLFHQPPSFEWSSGYATDFAGITMNNDIWARTV